MSDLLVIALAGFLASLVDGALGMGFGPTSSTILLSSGLSPAAASTTVNIAKVATGLAAGVSHWRFSNIDRRLVIRLALPGMLGAAIGAFVLTSVDGDDIRPLLAILLLLVGLRILARFSSPLTASGADGVAGPDSSSERELGNLGGVEVAAGVGGVTNGLVGAWGPVVTPFLLHRGTPPRYAVGSVNTAEVAVAVVSAGSLLSAGGGAGLSVATLAAMLGGGLLGAPLAAFTVRVIPARALGIACAGLLLITQLRELSRAGHLPVTAWTAYGLATVMIVAAAVRPRLGSRRPTEFDRADGLNAATRNQGPQPCIERQREVHHTPDPRS